MIFFVSLLLNTIQDLSRRKALKNRNNLLIIKIQVLCRSFIKAKIETRIVVIQAVIRRELKRCDVLNTLRAIRGIQSKQKQIVARKNIEEKLTCVYLLQRKIKALLCFNRYKSLKKHTLIIQRFYRRFSFRRKSSLYVLNDKKNTNIQKNITNLVSISRKFIYRKRFVQKINSLIYIQKWFKKTKKNFQVREKWNQVLLMLIEKSKESKIIKRNSNIELTNINEKRIEPQHFPGKTKIQVYKTLKTIEIINQSKTLLQMNSACTQLLLSIEESKDSRKMLVENPLAIGRLIEFIKECNRSMPSMKIVEVIVSIFKCLFRDESLYSLIYPNINNMSSALIEIIQKCQDLSLSESCVEVLRKSITEKNFHLFKNRLELITKNIENKNKCKTLVKKKWMQLISNLNSITQKYL